MKYLVWEPDETTVINDAITVEAFSAIMAAEKATKHFGYAPSHFPVPLRAKRLEEGAPIYTFKIHLVYNPEYRAELLGVE